MSTHGWIALALGILLSALLWGGLMYLSWYSHRNGMDDLDRSED